MRIFSVLTALLLSFPNSIAAQQAASSPPASSTQAITLLARSLSALAGSAPLNDVTLSGTVRRIAGSDDDAGTAVLKAIASGASRVDLTLPSGPRSETLNSSAAPATGAWSGPDGTSHTIPYHNLLTGPSWFFPAFIIAQGLSSSSYVATYVGPETHNDQAVQHVSISQPSLLSNSPGAPSSAHLTQIDLFLDSTTLLPCAIDFNTHPDNNELLDIPVEIRFFNYQAVNGVQVPFRIQKFLNNSLILDFQAQSATANSGLTAAVFTVEGN